MVHKGNLRVPTEAAVLVVGAGGMIGSALQTTLTSRGIPTVGTTRTGNGGAILLDLLAEPATWRIPDHIATAVLCAAITSTKACRERSAEARRVNVDATVALGRLLAGRGCRIIFLSTNMVFDGSVPFVPADTPTCPRTPYGLLKAEAEGELLSLGDAVTVVRLTKVFGPFPQLLQEWQGRLRAGDPIHPFADLVMAPVPLRHAVEVVAGVIAARLPGIVQVSATEDLSYAAVAVRLAESLGVDRSLVQPTLATAHRHDIEYVPRYTTLDASRARDALGLPAPNPWTALEEYTS